MANLVERKLDIVSAGGINKNDCEKLWIKYFNTLSRNMQTVWEVTGSVVMDTDGNNEEKTSSNYRLVEEEFTIAVPLVRPNPSFLALLQLAGATNEVFTMKEILHYMKLYIVERRLFDQYNPRIVHCQDELLGEVLQVPQFSIDEVLGLINKCCTQLPDTCLKRRRRLVSKPQQPSNIGTSNSQSTINVSSTTPTSVTISLCPSVRPSVCPSVRSSVSQSSNPSSSSETRDVKHKPVGKSCTVSRKSSSSSCDISDTNSNNTHDCNDSSMVTKETKEQENIVTSGTSSQTNVDNSSESEKSNTSCKRKNKGNASEGSGRKRHKTEPDMTTTSTGESSHRRHTSLSITYNDDNSNKDYPWYFQVQLGGDDDDDDDKSEVLSVQGKDTVIVQDSTDDLWFLEEESISVEVPSDTNFSVEYDVESDVSPGTESDLSSVKSGEGLLLICKESDVEFFADCSDSESDDGDKELSAADNWCCKECGLTNPPIQRYCNRCWKLRSDWLPSQLSSKMDDDKLCTRKSTSDSSVKDNDLFKELSFNKSKDTDSGISSTLPSSQESSCLDSDKLDKVKCVPEITPLSQELQNNDSRCTFSNFQLENENKSTVKINDNNSAYSTVNSSCKIDSSKFIDVSASSTEDRCMICLTGTKTASLIHGSSGHQVCCYSCAKRLKRRGKLCPVCRRPIQKVVRNYVL
ncbi:E3 ubiquitin-protein ligase Mdm2 [Mactra antiquata]